MSGVKAMIVLVQCTADVLVCETVPIDQTRYASMDTCNHAIAQVLSEKRAQESNHIWMGKCAYRLSTPDPRRIRRERRFDQMQRIDTARINR